MAVDPSQLAQQDSDFVKQAGAANQAGEEKQAQAEPSFLQKWVTDPVGRVTTQALDSAVSAADTMYDSEPGKKVRDVAAGAITGMTNIADAAHSFGQAVVKDQSRSAQERMQDVADPAQATREEHFTAPTPSPIWDHAKGAILDFRDAVAVQDPTLADNLTQSVAQLALPFSGYSRALSGLHGVASMVAGGALTDATALGPHDMRMADMIALGRHTEGKLGDALRTLAPDGSALNAYVNFLTDRGNESEAEGRFKNVLDGFGANLIATPLIHGAAMVLKQGTAGLRSAVEAGASKLSDLIPKVDDSPLPVRSPVEQYEQAMKAKNVPLQNGAPVPDGAAAMAAPKGWAQTGGGVTPEDGSSLNAAPGPKAFSSVLQTMADNPTGAPLGKLTGALMQHLPDDEEGNFYREVLGRVTENNPETKVLAHSKPFGGTALAHLGEVQGRYIGDDFNEVHLYPSAFRNPARLTHVFTHEAVHAVTVKAMIESKPVYNGIQSLMSHAESSPEVAKALTNKPDRYGFTNPKEFVAEIESNPKFRNAMKSVVVPDADTGKPSTVWEAYKKTIAGILGVGGTLATSPMFDKLLTKEGEKNGA